MYNLLIVTQKWLKGTKMIPYIQELKREDKATFYSIASGQDILQVVIAQNGGTILQNGQKADSDLAQIVIEELRELVNEETKDANQLEKALAVLKGLGVPTPEKYEPAEENTPMLTREQKREIRIAFKEWKGYPNEKQKEILDTFGLAYAHVTKGYGRIYCTGNPNIEVSTSHTPRNKGSAARDIAGDIINRLLPQVYAAQGATA